MVTKAARFNQVLSVAIVLGNVCCMELGWAADGARLFDTKSIVPKTKEREILSGDEVKSLEFTRAQRHGDQPMYSRITVVQLNMAAFESGILTLITPDGKEFQYIGTKRDTSAEKHFKVAGEMSFSWYGKSARGTLTVGYSGSKGEVGVSGAFDEEGRQYGFRSIGNTGRRAIVFELPPMGPWSDGSPEAAPGIPIPPDEPLRAR